MTPELEARFWSLVSIPPDVLAGCWTWRGPRSPEGYGRFTSSGTRASAHRIAFELMGGRFPRRHVLRETCGRRDCVNPAHHRLISRAVHSREIISGNDWAKGGTWNRGTGNAMAKLNEIAVIAIRRLAATGSGLEELAEAFGVHTWTVESIVQRKRWKHIPEGA
jgi:hypothetical protein